MLSQFALSPQQRQLLMIPPPRAHRIELRLDGVLDRNRLLRSFNALLRDHESLRTRVPWPERSLQVIEAFEPIVEIPCDLPSLESSPVSLSLSSSNTTLTLRVDALNVDWRSAVRLVQLLSQQYVRPEHGAQEIKQYADLAVGFEVLLREERGSRYWRSRLDNGMVPSNGIPGKAGLGETDVARFDLHKLSKALSEQRAFDHLSLRHIAFPLWVLYVSRLMQQQEVVVQYRDAMPAVLENVLALGTHGRVLSLPFSIDWNSPVVELFRTLQSALEMDLAHAEFFDPASTPLDRCCGSFVYQPAAPVCDAFAGLRILDARWEPFAIHSGFELRESGDGMGCELRAASSTWIRPAECFQNFARLVEFCATQPEAPLGHFEWLSKRSSAVRAQQPSSPQPFIDLHDALETWATTRPNDVAVSDAEGTLTYRELRAAVAERASLLKQRGVVPGTIVGLHLARSRHWVIFWLACWRVNAVVLPLPESDPPARIAAVIRRCSLRYVVSKCAAWSIDSLCCIDPDAIAAGTQQPMTYVPPACEQTAYILFTSGSTGVPKGVRISHGALSNYLRWAQEAYAHNDSAATLLHSELSFDFTQTCLWLPLLKGSRLTILPPKSELSELKRALDAQPSLAFVKLTPGHLQGIAALELQTQSPTTWPPNVVIGGSALTQSMLPPSLRAASSRIHNEYGPTEATVGCSLFTAVARVVEPGNVPIGMPCPGNEFLVLDRFLNCVPRGTPGELYIAGAQLAEEFMDDPAETARNFVPHHHSSRGGSRLYRTGDRVREVSENQYEFLGRVSSSQIKLRGQRVELGEIVAKLQEFPGVRGAHVIVTNRDTEALRVIGYVAAPPSLDPSALRAWLATQLPSAALPHDILRLDVLPCNARGKVDEHALIDLWTSRSDQSAPRNLTEQRLLSVWREVLRVESMGIDANFFALGGDSIRSVQAAALAARSGVGFTIMQLFRAPTIRALAQEISSTNAIPAEKERAVPLLDEADRSKLPANVVEAYPLSRLQLGMIFHNTHAGAEPLYHDIFSYKLQLSAPFQVDLLRQAVRSLVARHAALRTTFDITNFSEPLQLVWSRGEDLLEYEDLQDREERVRTQIVTQHIEAEKARGFDVTVLPLVRLKVHRLAPNVIQLTTSFHHSVMDGWSDQQIHTELFEHYRSLRSGLQFHAAGSPGSYISYVAKERQAIASAKHREFWSTYLRESVPSTVAGAARKDEQCTDAVVTQRIVPSPQVAATVAKCSQAWGIPIKAILQAVHFRALSELLERTDVTSCVVMDGRLEGFEAAVGLFINSVPVRMRTDGSGSWRALAQAAFDSEQTIYPFRHLPLVEIHQLLGVQTLSSVLFYFTSFHNGIHAPAELTLLDKRSYEVSSFPLAVSFNVDPFSGELTAAISVNQRRFGARIAEIVAVYQSVLTRLAAAPEESSVSAVHPATTGSVARASRPRMQEDLLEQFQLQVRRGADRVAVVAGDHAMTYSELSRRIDNLTHRLLQDKVSARDVVGIVCERGIELVIALLAVLKAGASFILIGSKDPGERARMAQQRCTYLIQTGPGELNVMDLAGARDAIESVAIEPLLLPHQVAYRMHTSGSSGVPKCVVVERSSYSNVLSSFRELLGVSAHDIVASTSATSFDISLLEFCLPLISGAKLEIVPDSVVRDPQLLALHLAAANVTVMQATPTIWGMLQRNGWQGSRQIKALVGGEKLPKPLASWLVDSVPVSWNVYGPTETTIWSTAKQLSEHEHGIGTPVAGVACYVLDESLRAVAPGSVGQLFIGGCGVAACYDADPASSAAAFIPDPFSADAGARMYCTGDFVSMNEAGELQFHGRRDRQIKMHGRRLELNEVEGLLERHPKVLRAAVVHRRDASDEYLCAYVLGDARESPDEISLRTHLEQFLPPELIPSIYMFVDELPRSSSGKIDYGALPPPVRARRPAHNYVAPVGEAEELLCDLWSRALRIDRVGVEDTFAELGGNSLTALVITSQLRKLLEIEVTVAALFHARTIRSLAAHMLEAYADSGIHTRIEILQQIRKQQAG